MKAIIVDYKVGNFRNVQRAFARVGLPARISPEAAAISNADAIILPGVGAFGDAMNNLRALGIERPLKAAAAAGKPFFGICVGMQLLFAESDEMGQHEGLGLLPGRVTRFRDGLRIPHMGWNAVEPVGNHPLTASLTSESYAYFAHSYICVPAKPAHVVGQTNYEGHFVSAVAHKNIVGIQFHPEKSQQVGLQILHNFKEMVS